MEIRELVVFITVAEELNFTRAAARLRTAQSAVSATIRQLESELGATLFERSTRRVALSPAGVSLLPKARAVLDSAADAKDSVAELNGEVSGALALGIMTSVTLVDVPRILGEYSVRFPNVQIAMRASERGSHGHVEMLKSGQLDIAFIANPDHLDRDLQLATLASSALILAVPLGHSMAHRVSARFEELLELPFIESPAGFGNRAVIDAAFAHAGVTRTSRIEISDIAEAAALARNGLGVVFIPEHMTGVIDGLHAIRIEDENLQLEVAVATSQRRRRSRATQSLWDIAVGNN